MANPKIEVEYTARCSLGRHLGDLTDWPNGCISVEHPSIRRGKTYHVKVEIEEVKDAEDGKE